MLYISDDSIEYNEQSVSMNYSLGADETKRTFWQTDRQLSVLTPFEQSSILKNISKLWRYILSENTFNNIYSTYIYVIPVTDDRSWVLYLLGIIITMWAEFY